MTQKDANEARLRIQDAISFTVKGGGYFYPNKVVDRNALTLLKIDFRPSKDPDEIHRQFSHLPDGVTLEFIDPV